MYENMNLQKNIPTKTNLQKTNLWKTNLMKKQNLQKTSYKKQTYKKQTYEKQTYIFPPVPLPLALPQSLPFKH